MTFSLELDLLTTFEVIGLTLAVIGFFNLSTHLERAFSVMQGGMWRFAIWRIKMRNELWPPHKNWDVIVVEALMGWAVASIFIAAIVIWMEWWEPLKALLLALPRWQLIAGALASLVLLIPFELILVFGNSTLMAGVFYVLSRLFWLLGLPPAGVTGTIGLLVTIATFVIGRTEWIV